MKFLLLFPVLALLLGCPGKSIESNLKYVQPIQLEGKWVSPCAFEICLFLLLELDEDGNAIVVAAESGGGAQPIAALNNFNSDKYYFSVEVSDIKPASQHESLFSEGQKLQGYATQGELCFQLPEDEEKVLRVCFMRFEEFKNTQSLAIESLERYKLEESHNKTRNELDGSDEPPIR